MMTTLASGPVARRTVVHPTGPAFTAALNDDLNTSAALAVVHDVIHQGSAATAADDKAGVRAALTDVRAMLGVLGLDPLDPAWHGGDDGGHIKAVVGPLVALALEQRARTQAVDGGRLGPRPAQERGNPGRGHSGRTPLDVAEAPLTTRGVRPW
jgi:cysteinyl-tRNA synthetase